MRCHKLGGLGQAIAALTTMLGCDNEVLNNVSRSTRMSCIWLQSLLWLMILTATCTAQSAFEEVSFRSGGWGSMAHTETQWLSQQKQCVASQQRTSAPRHLAL